MFNCVEKKDVQEARLSDMGMNLNDIKNIDIPVYKSTWGLNIVSTPIFDLTLYEKGMDVRIGPVSFNSSYKAMHGIMMDQMYGHGAHQNLDMDPLWNPYAETENVSMDYKYVKFGLQKK